jgi:hypothetical protein
MRGRNRGGRGPNPLQRSYESNGPDVKVRGTAQHIAEKYAQLARDAQASGDPVMAENYFQHAEHYWRIVLAAQEQMTQQYGHQFQPARPFGDDGDDGDEEGDDEGSHYPLAADQPVGPGSMGGDDQPYGQEGRSEGRSDGRGQRDGQNRDNGWRNDSQGRGGQRFDRNDRNNRRFDRQGGQGQDRQGNDRQNNAHQQGERQDRNERQGNERLGRERFERPRRDDANGEQPRFEAGDQPERAQQAEVEGRRPRTVIDADAAPIGLPSFVTQPRRKPIEIDAAQPDEPAPAPEAAAPRRRGRPPGARNKPKVASESAAD